MGVDGRDDSVGIVEQQSVEHVEPLVVIVLIGFLLLVVGHVSLSCGLHRYRLGLRQAEPNLGDR